MKQIKNIKSVTGKGLSISGLAVLIFALSAIIPISANAKSPSYVLECRGGGRMNARIYDAGSITIFGYRRAKSAASVQPPGPGKCAWLDRPMNKYEQLNIDYIRSKLPFRHVVVNSSKTTFLWKRNYPITTVLRAIRRNKLFFVHVRKKRVGNHWTLRIVRVGP